MKRRVVMNCYSQRAPIWCEGVVTFMMKKGSELCTDFVLPTIDTATGSPVIEIGYTHKAVPEEVGMVTY